MTTDNTLALRGRAATRHRRGGRARRDALAAAGARAGVLATTVARSTRLRRLAAPCQLHGPRPPSRWRSR